MAAPVYNVDKVSSGGQITHDTTQEGRNQKEPLWTARKQPTAGRNKVTQKRGHGKAFEGGVPFIKPT